MSYFLQDSSGSHPVACSLAPLQTWAPQLSDALNTTVSLTSHGHHALENGLEQRWAPHSYCRGLVAGSPLSLKAQGLSLTPSRTVMGHSDALCWNLTLSCLCWSHDEGPYLARSPELLTA